MTALNEAMAGLTIPGRMQRLPISPRGFPVPWFVQWMEDGKPVPVGRGVPDFRVADYEKRARAIKQRLCWLCGLSLGRHLTFVIGPMCAVSRTTAEPACHHDCAVFAAVACPFLVKPAMRRNEKDMPEGSMPGEAILRNPGVTCLWTTRTFEVFNADAAGRGFLIRIGKPEHVEWMAQGRVATRAEIMASFDSGYPILMEMAVTDGPDAVADLEKQRRAALAYVPA